MLSIMYFEVITYFMYLNVGELYILFCVSSNHFFGLLYWNSKLNCSRNRPSDFYCHPSWQGIGRKRTSRPQEDVANGILVDSFLLLVSVSKLGKQFCILYFGRYKNSTPYFLLGHQHQNSILPVSQDALSIAASRVGVGLPMFPDFSARLKKVDSFSLLQYCFRSRTLIPLLMVSFQLLHQLWLPADGRRVQGILPVR